MDDEESDGASETGPEEYAADVTPLEVARPRSQVIKSALEHRRGGFANTVFPASEFDEKTFPDFGWDRTRMP